MVTCEKLGVAKERVELLKRSGDQPDLDLAMLVLTEVERLVKTASATQVRQPIYGKAVDGWKRYARHLEPLLEALGPLAGDS